MIKKENSGVEITKLKSEKKYLETKNVLKILMKITRKTKLFLYCTLF